jgi:hypothetical protein
MKKKINKSIGYLYTILLFFLICIIITDNNILKKIHKILFNEDYSKRIEKRYGFCENSSIGYIRYIKKKYKLNFNPKIINFAKTAPLNWAIYDLNLNYDPNKIILLNYSEYLDLNFTKQNINSWEFKEDYKEINIKSINQIKFHTVNDDARYIEGKVNLYTVNNKNKITLIYSWRINQNISTQSLYINNLANDLSHIHKKLIIKLDILDNKVLDDITNITLRSKNIIDIEKFNIINQIGDCYYVSARN